MAIGFDTAAFSWHAARLVARVPGMALHRYVLVAVPVAGLPDMPRGFEAASLACDEVVAAGLVEPRAAAWRDGQGMACIGVRRGAAVVGITWLTTARFEEDEAHLAFVPPPGAAWDTGMAIAREARGGRAFAALWAATRGWAEPRGVRWSVSRIADYNLGSRRAHARLGGVEIGRVSVLRTGGRQWVWGTRPFASRLGGERPVVALRVPS